MIQAIQPPAHDLASFPATPVAPRPGDASGAAAPFAEVLASASVGGESRETLVREQARKLVATTFVSPLLARMREDPFRSDLFHGGFAEDAFGAQLDTILADRIVDQMDTRAAAQPGDAGGAALVDLVYQHIMNQAGPAQPARTAPTGDPARAYAGAVQHE